VRKSTRVYFATDLHGSSKCFRKFLNAAVAYDADVLVLGGDLAGKALVTLVRGADGRYRTRFMGRDHELEAGPELDALETLIEDHGYYVHRAAQDEANGWGVEGGKGSSPAFDALFLRLMKERLTSWLELADQRLRPTGKRLFFMLGNDDPPELGALLEQAPYGTADEGRAVWLDDGHEMISWGYSNVTPWHSYREQTEPELAESLRKLAALLSTPSAAIVNVHVPPFDSGLDEAPALDADLRVVQVLGQVKLVPVGSTAVRDLLLSMQPLLGLHGHIHEASGIRRLGRTVAINPGSDYATGTLNGALISLERDKLAAFQLVRG
jgi:Icc-related predicted phosphoesterase